MAAQLVLEPQRDRLNRVNQLGLCSAQVSGRFETYGHLNSPIEQR